MKNKKIFIALSNLESPNPIADYGIELAKQLDRGALLFSTTKVPLYTPPVSMGKGADNAASLQMQAVQQDSEQKIKEVYQYSKAKYDRVNYEIEIGFLQTSVVEKTEEKKPYLAVVEGNSELTTLHEWFGTYETYLAEQIESPVLVVPHERPWRPVKKMLYLMDMVDHKVENMRILTSIAEELDAALTVVIIANTDEPEDQANFEQTTAIMKNLLGYNHVDFHRVFTEESAAAVAQLLESTQADWLAFEHKSYSFLERVLDDYNTKRLILQSEIPVLVF